jgi:hypothetical protein
MAVLSPHTATIPWLIFVFIPMSPDALPIKEVVDAS